MRDKRCGIIVSARRHGEFNQHPGLLVGRLAQCEHLADSRLVNRVGHAVGADEHAVAVDELKSLEIDRWTDRSGHAKSSR